MDRSNKCSKPIGSSSFFGRMGNHCDLDEMAFSPPSSEISPFIYIDNPRIPKSNTSTTSTTQNYDQQQTATNFDRRKSSNGFASGAGVSVVGNVSKVISRQSFDNLHDLMRDQRHEENTTIGDFDDINQVSTQSLPATPFSTPIGTPQGSPKPQTRRPHYSRHHDDAVVADELHCTLPWYYPGFMTVPPEEASIVCKSSSPFYDQVDKAAADKFVNPGSKLLAGNTTSVYLKHSKLNRNKYVVTNRDMNFLAPTSM